MTRAAERNSQLVRILQIIRDLDRVGGIDLYELARLHGTTVRTIRRDLDALGAVGLPLVQEADGKRKRWRIAFKDHLTRLSELVDASHYLALRMAMGGGASKSSTLYASLEDLADKLEQALGVRGRKQLQAIESCLFSYEKFAFRRAAPEVLWPLVGAILERRLCSVTYRAPRARAVDKTFRILPLRLFLHQGAVYLHAHVPKHDNVILLHLHRLQRLEVLDERRRPPRHFRPERWEAMAFGVFTGGPPATYRLRFERGAAPYISERVWHPTQRLREFADGRLELTFRCSESIEVMAWVASWHAAVEVLEPESLRSELLGVGERYATMYSGKAAMRPVAVRRPTQPREVAALAARAKSRS